MIQKLKYIIILQAVAFAMGFSSCVKSPVVVPTSAKLPPIKVDPVSKQVQKAQRSTFDSKVAIKVVAEKVSEASTKSTEVKKIAQQIEKKGVKPGEDLAKTLVIKTHDLERQIQKSEEEVKEADEAANEAEAALHEVTEELIELSAVVGMHAQQDQVQEDTIKTLNKSVIEADRKLEVSEKKVSKMSFWASLGKWIFGVFLAIATIGLIWFLGKNSLKIWLKSFWPL